MGGSFALALKRAGLVRRVVGYSPSDTTRQRALDRGVLNAALPSIADAARAGGSYPRGCSPPRGAPGRHA